MTDREMIEFCLKAFEAIPAAYSSKAFMKNQGHYLPRFEIAGPAPYRLARKMQRVLREHLGIDNE